MRSERDKCGDLYYYGTPREERPRWQNIARETDRNPQASYGASRVIVQYTGDGMRDAYPTHQQVLT